MSFADIHVSYLLSQLLVGLINGAFYAMLSLGLAIIFGLLNIINMVHGAQYMMGAFIAYLLLTLLGIGYWPALVLVPLIVAGLAMALERFVLKRISHLDHLYGLLLTLGLTLLIEGAFRQGFGSTGHPYQIPALLRGALRFGTVVLPVYRAWIIVASIGVCAATWYVIERTRLGSYLRAAKENAPMVQAFGVNVPRMINLTYGFGAGLAALTGVFAAPIYQVSPQMGSDLIIVVFAVVVIGGLGSISGAIMSGFALGLIEGLTKIFYPEASNTIIFLIMMLVLLVRPAGIFGSIATIAVGHSINVATQRSRELDRAAFLKIAIPIFVVACAAPFFVFPVFLMETLCFALFACAFNLLVGYAGLLSFGHAAFFGGGAYITAYAIQALGLPPEIGILLGVAAASLVGLVFGWVSIRRQGIYFAMTTLALAQMIYFIALQAPFTGGEDGIQHVARGKLFGIIDLNNTMALYFVVLTICGAGFLLFYRIIHSPFGQILKAIRENEPRTVSLGFNVNRYKLLAFVLSAALAGLAGSTKLIVFQIATLTDVHWSMSGQVVLMTLLGGLGTITGPLVGAFLVVALENYLAPFGSWVSIIQGAVFVVCVLSFRRGIVGEIGAAFKSLGTRDRRKNKIVPQRQRPADTNLR